MEDNMKAVIQAFKDGDKVKGLYGDSELEIFNFSAPKRVINIFYAVCEAMNMDGKKVMATLMEMYAEDVRNTAMVKK